MNELDLIVDLHKNSVRQGPGSEQETLKALECLNLSDDKQILMADIGCGAGQQTITLAQNCNASIFAIDIFPEFLEKLNLNSKQLKLDAKIKTINVSMDELPFENEQLDVVWAEGAIYNIGFENGIKKWKKFIKKQGYLAVSEITWITDTRPKEIEDFWMREYPEISIASHKINILEQNGFSLMGYFIIKEESWIQNYYKLLEDDFEDFLLRNNNSPLAQKVLQDYKFEIELFRKFKDYFSYGFYIAKKN